jgi:uncharacterized circularly permuted ATP-grasp superfamily protein/uncharacterized alpha-E superfamily protein
MPSSTVSPSPSVSPQEILDQLQQKNTHSLHSLPKKIQRELSYLINPYTTQASRHLSIYQFSIHPLPFILPQDQWQLLTQCLKQRLQAWNLALADIYSEQDLIRDRILPHRLIYSDPNYIRPILGIKPIGETHIRFAAIDFIQDATGQWHVLEEIFSQPYGIGLTLHLRQSLSEIYTHELNTLPIESPSSIPAIIQENLQKCGYSFSRRPRIAILTPGHNAPTYADHAILARMMGIPLIQPDELIVLQGQLFLKTIDGLQPIEILHRYIPSHGIDPVSIPSHNIQKGIPGLISCLRKGTVAIANALSTDLLQNRALTIYTPHIISHLLHQRSILPDIFRGSLTDVDLREQLFDDWSPYIVKSIHPQIASPSIIGAHLTKEQRRHWQRIIEQAPHQWILQKNILHQSLPSDPIILRLFAIADSERITVLPCAFTRSLRQQNPHANQPPPTSIRDTWILQAPTPAPHDRATEITLTPPHTHEIVGDRLRLSSRTAEGLLWIGRYLTRAATTTQLLRTLLQIRATTDPEHFDAKTWQPLWETLAAATGHPTRYFKKSNTGSPSQLSHYILLSTENTASTTYCISQAHINVLACRESIPLELFTLITDLHHMLKQASVESPETLQTRLSDLTLHNTIIQALEQITGAAQHHILRDDTWHFWNIGHHIEHAIFTTLTFRQLILRLHITPSTTPLIFDALLRIFACQYAHRAHYPHRPTLHSIASILLTLPTFPRSLSYHLSSLHQHLTQCFPDTPPTAVTPAIRALHRLCTLQTLPLASLCASTGQHIPLADWLAQETQHLNQLATTITDYHIHHYQAHLLNPSYAME